jgi:putative addiction module CopG family antidote
METPPLETFIHQAVTSGRFQSVSEIVCAALRLLEEHEQQKAAAQEWLEAEVQKGLDSGGHAGFWQGLRSKLQQSGSAG